VADNTAQGGSNTIATDERTINAAAVHVQRVDEQGSTAIAAGQVNISNTAATLVSARETRKRVVIANREPVDIYVGAPTVTTTTGFKVEAGDSLTLYTTALVQAISGAAAPAGDRVHFIEEYDT